MTKLYSDRQKLLSLLFATLTAVTPAVGAVPTRFISVPESCAEALASFPRDQLNDVIDWGGIQEGMVDIGVAPSRVALKLTVEKWNSDRALQRIRSALADGAWTFGNPLADPDLNKLAVNLLSQKYGIDLLPYLASLRQFDTADLVFRGLSESRGNPLFGNVSRYASRRDLARFYPLWLRGAHALESAKLFVEQSLPFGYEEVARIEGYLNPGDRQAFKVAVADLIQQKFNDTSESRLPYETAARDLALTLALPWRDLPDMTRNYLSRHWVDLDRFPPLSTPAVRTIGAGEKWAGHCGKMIQGHFRSLNLDEDCAKPRWEAGPGSVLINLHGQLVGSLKLEPKEGVEVVGDPSMLALRNVMDAEGRLILAMGGVYHLSYAIYEKALQVRGSGDSLELETLEVSPNTFLFNYGAWYTEKEDLLLSLADEGSRERSLKDQSIHPRRHHQVFWFALLKRLDLARRRKSGSQEPLASPPPRPGCLGACIKTILDLLGELSDDAK